MDKNKLTEIGPVIEEEVYHCLRRFKEKAPGKSGITRNTLLNVPANIAQSLVEIYNGLLAAGHFPDKLKLAKMIFHPQERQR